MIDDYEPIVERVDDLVLAPTESLFLLKTLCVLTWTFHLVAFFIFLFYAFNVDDLQAKIDRANGVHFGWVLITLVLLPVITSLGAFFLFRAKKWGFWIYLFGQLAFLLVLADQFMWKSTENQQTDVLGTKGQLLLISIIVVSFGFIILYATQLSKIKSWKKKPSTLLNDL